jgi:lipoyl(octanoyl) transferase
MQNIQHPTPNIQHPIPELAGEQAQPLSVGCWMLDVACSDSSLLNSGPCPPAWNMALDEALLEAAPRLGQPVLRFYGWTEPAASFGYFQRFAEVERATRLRPLVRRPTAGGIVPHDADWTYSLAFPAGHEWFRLTAVESYRRVHTWLQAAFAKLRVETELASCGRKSAPGQCFVGHEKFDLLWQGRKIAGAAQRRTRAGLLIQGSVQPPPLGLRRADWEGAMVAVAGEPWEEIQPDATLRERVEQLVEQKYAQETFLKKR